MSKPTKKKKPQAPLAVPQTDKQYLRAGMARRLPIAECWASNNWKVAALELVSVVVTRQHKNGNYTVGTYLVDMKSVGLKRTTYRVNYPAGEYGPMLADFSELQTMERVEYVVAHNVIYGAIAYADDLGIRPLHAAWAISQYILDEDTDDIELIELEYGLEGRPFYVGGPYDKPANILAKLDKAVGPGNYGYVAYDPSFHSLAPLMGSAFDDNNDGIDETDDDWKEADVVE